MNSNHPYQDVEQILKELENHAKIKVAVTDLDGVLRGKYLDKKKFLSVADGGLNFCNVIFGWDSSDVCYDNSKYTGWHTGYPDAKVRVDLKTFRKIPWDKNTPFFLGDFEEEEGTPLQICPRQLLKKVLKKAEKMGYSTLTGMEYEWFNFQETPQSLAEKKHAAPTPLTPGMFGYSILRSSLNQNYFHALMDEMSAFQVPIEGLHTETGPGVFEAAILFGETLEAADRATLFKTGVKEIAYRFGIIPSFMAKWNASLPGCSGHLHQSLWNPEGTKNLFYDSYAPHGMSELFKSFLAGQILCLPEILPFFAPNVNSYKRLVEGYWAPTQAAWGIDNRTVAFRVIPGSEKSTRIEVRVPGSDVNPYLAMSASIAAGLYGIEKNLQLDSKPIVGSAYLEQKGTKTVRLPKNLHEATQKMAESQIAHEILGETFVDHFARSREWEWRQFQNSVTNWELQRYFEII